MKTATANNPADQYRLDVFGYRGLVLFYSLQASAEQAGAWNGAMEVRADAATAALIDYANLARNGVAIGKPLPDEHRQAARRLMEHWGLIAADTPDRGTDAEGVDLDLIEIMNSVPLESLRDEAAALPPAEDAPQVVRLVLPAVMTTAEGNGDGR